MIFLSDLLSGDPSLRSMAGTLEMDPLAEEDALQEAQVVDLRIFTGDVEGLGRRL